MPSVTPPERFPWSAFQAEHDKHSDWPSPKVASKFAGVAQARLFKWSRNGCPLLDGRRLTTKMFPVPGGGRSVECYSRIELDEIRLAKAALPSAKKSKLTDWVTLAEAARELHLTIRTLRGFIFDKDPYLGRRPSTSKQRAVIRSGRTQEIIFIARKDLEEMIRKRAPRPIPEGRIPIEQASKRLGVTGGTLTKWLPSCPHLEGRPLDYVPDRVMSDASSRRRFLLSEVEVEEIRRKMRDGPSKPYTDESGTWLPMSLALSKYPNASKNPLCKYRNKPCPQLGGRILHAIKVRRTPSSSYSEVETWVYLEADLKLLQPTHYGRQPGQSGLPLAESTAQPEEASGATRPAVADEGEESQPEERPRDIGGRPTGRDTKALHKFCWEARQRGEKRAITMRRANSQFGENAILEARYVTIYASRHKPEPISK